MKLLLALSNTRDREEVVRNILQELQPDDQLILLFVLDRRVPETVSSWLLYLGFMGETLTGEIGEVIFRELTQAAEQRVKEIRQQAERRGVRVKVLFREGPFFEALKEVYEAEQPDRVVFCQEEGVLFADPEPTPPLPFPYEEY